MVIDFLWHLRGSRSLARVPDDDRVIAAIERLLLSQLKPVACRTPDSIAFNQPLWKPTIGPNWLSMLIYDRGHFWIEKSHRGRRLHYDLSSLHGFIFCVTGSVFLFVFALGATGSLFSAAGIAALAFGWLYGGNLLLAIPRTWLAIGLAVRRAQSR